MEPEIKKNSEWSVAKSLEYYNIEHWGAGYFSINEKGNLCVCPYGQPGPSIDFCDVIDEIHDKKITLPCIVRFQDILRSRVETLNKTFEKYIHELGYGGRYFGVYPIKVNQMREVVEEILDAGAPYHLGLEAGSKGELLAVLALNTDPEALTICNGYKDEEFMRLALLGRKLDRKVIVVIEKLSELSLLLKLAEEMQVEPLIGLRAKLSTPGAGKWVLSSGDFAKFGLTIPEMIQALEILKSTGKEKNLILFHFHAGSQLTDIRTIKEAVSEGSRIYAKIRKMGFPVEYFDVGGGLGVDYDGTNTTSDSSVNYTVEEYISDVIYTLRQICHDEAVPEPNIVSESGRALTAHHSCLIIPVFGNIELGSKSPWSETDQNTNGKEAQVVTQMREIVSCLTMKNLLETFHDATAKKEDALTMFKYGILGLEDRAKVEALYWKLCRQIVDATAKRKRVPKDTAHLDKVMADQYLANFSVFQSAPDHWAFSQLFPVVPLQRLNEAPTRTATVVDITCDSDGKIVQFIDPAGSRSTIALHELREGEPYRIGLFLLGAYQDIMGDMHNLFGRVNEVHVFCDDEDPEDFYLEEVIPGDSIADVLCRLQYHPAELNKVMKKSIDEKIKAGIIKPKDGMTLIDFYEKVMGSYTYLLTDQHTNGRTEKDSSPAYRSSESESAQPLPLIAKSS